MKLSSAVLMERWVTVVLLSPYHMNVFLSQVKVGQLRNNKTALLFSTESYVVSLCASPDGKSILSGHLDGSIYRFTFEDVNGEPVHVSMHL